MIRMQCTTFVILPTWAVFCAFSLPEGDTGICGVTVLMSFYCGDAVNKISICGVAMILNPSVCDVCVFHSAVFGEKEIICGAVVSCLVFLRPKFSRHVNVVNPWQLFGSTCLSCSWTFLKRAFP